MLTTIDCWGTLLTASPVFSTSKIVLTRKFFPSRQPIEVMTAFWETKQVFNNIIEKTGMQPKREYIFQFLFTQLGGKYTRLPLMRIYMAEYESLALLCPPSIYSDETRQYLTNLDLISELAICSNTMFLSGKCLRKMLDSVGISSVFKHMRFSDEAGVAKPHPDMYMRSQFHIGDHQITDYEGPLAAKSTPFLINSNTQTLKDAYNFIAQSVAIRS